MEINSATLEIIKEFNLPKYKEIPNVGLYLDQTSKYINEALNLQGNFVITNSMIANYVKHKIISNPVAKQYNRDQIAALIFITLTKSAISLDNVKQLFETMKEKYEPAQAYRYFAELFDSELRQVFGVAEKEEKQYATEEEKLLHRIIVVVVNEVYLEECFKSL